MTDITTQALSESLTDAMQRCEIAYRQMINNGSPEDCKSHDDARAAFAKLLAGIGADRQQRGEPMAYLRKDQLRQIQHRGPMHGEISTHARAGMVAVYAAPQPAAPDTFERAKSIIEKWPGWKRDYVLVKPNAPAQEPSDDLMNALRNQRQIDRDGTEVGVSRQALDEAIVLLASYGAAQQSVPDAEPMYFLQDTRSYVGNCPMWWAKDGNGYTTRLDEAHRYTYKEAMRQHQSRDTDLPWLCSEVEALQRPTVDIQHMRSVSDQRAAMQQEHKP